MKNSAECRDKYTKTCVPALHFFPFFFTICLVMNSSTLFGLKQLVVTGTHACFLSIYCTRRLHRNTVVWASPLNSAVLSPMPFLAMHILTYKSVMFYPRRGKKGKKSSDWVHGEKEEKFVIDAFWFQFAIVFQSQLHVMDLSKTVDK